MPGSAPTPLCGATGPASRELTDGPLGRWVPTGRAKSDGAPCNLCLHLKITLHPQNLESSFACGRLGRQSSFLLLGLLVFLFFPLQSPSFLRGLLSTSVDKVQVDRGEMQSPIALYIHLPLSRAHSPPAASRCTAAIPTSVCLSAAGLGCMLPPSPSLPPVSSQTKVGDAFFRSQRQLVSSFPETITLLLRTNVDICRKRGKKASQEVQTGKRPSSYLTTVPIPPGSHLRLKPEFQ